MFDDQAMNTEAGEALLDPADSASADDLRRQLAEANARAEDNYNKFLFAMADFENYKRRMQRDAEANMTHYRRGILERFLPVLDNLERALQFDKGGESLRNGIEQTLRGFEAILAGQGVRVVDVKDKPFDPRVAEAIGTAEAGDDVDDETVVEVAEKGYTIAEELLRPAKVIVAKRG